MPSTRDRVVSVDRAGDGECYDANKAQCEGGPVAVYDDADFVWSGVGVDGPVVFKVGRHGADDGAGGWFY